MHSSSQGLKFFPAEKIIIIKEITGQTFSFYLKRNSWGKKTLSFLSNRTRALEKVMETLNKGTTKLGWCSHKTQHEKSELYSNDWNMILCCHPKFCFCKFWSHVGLLLSFFTVFLGTNFCRTLSSSR